MEVANSGTATIESVAFSPDGSTLAIGSDDDSVRVFDIRHGSSRLVHRLLGATSFVNSVAFSPDGKSVAAGSADGSLRLFDPATGALVESFDGPNPITGVDFASNGSTLVVSDSAGQIRLWQLPARSTLTTSGNAYVVQFVERGKVLTAVTGGPAGELELWGVSDPAQPGGEAQLSELASISTPTGFGPVAGSGAVNPSGTLAAVANSKAEIQLMDIADPSHPRPVGPVLLGNKPLVEQMGFSAGGQILAASDDSGQVRLWDVADPAHPVALPTLTGTKREVLGISFSPDGHLLAAAGTNDKVALYDIADPQAPRLLASLGGFANYAYATAFTPNGRTLVAGSADGTVRLWDVSDPSHPRPLGPALSGPTGYVLQVAVSADGKTLAESTSNGSVWLWDISDPSQPRKQAELEAATDSVFTVGFDPAGPLLAASGSDQTLHLWSYQPVTAASQICAAAGDGITTAEWSTYVQGESYRPPCGK